MNYNLVVVLSFSIAISGIIGLVRYKKISQAYYPFIFAVWLGFLNELISFIVIKGGHSNAINSNIYVLIESLFIVWFFLRQGLFVRSKKIFIALIILLILAWVFENFYLSSIKRFSSYFIVLYSFVTVLMSINLVNHLISNERKMLIRNSAFLICMGFILFYTCTILIEVFWIYGLNSSKDFRFQVYRIMTYLNLFVNLIYALAVLWIPTKREYTLL